MLTYALHLVLGEDFRYGDIYYSHMPVMLYQNFLLKTHVILYFVIHLSIPPLYFSI